MTSYTKDDRRYEYSYNSDGMRTVKRVYEGNELVYTYTYIWDGDVLLGGRMEVTDADEPISIRYLYDESGELYGMGYNGNGYFAFIKNLQGDIVSIVPLDSESNVEINMEYDAWGKPIIKQASSLAEGFMMAVLMAVTNVGYRGYFYDFETGLYYLRSRYYDPEIGRFINADDTDYLGYDKSPLSMNVFAYCENSPVNRIDPSGNRTGSFSSFVSNFKSDKQGRELLKYYLYGNGKKQNISSKDWTNYLNANNAKMCRCKRCNYSNQTLKYYIWSYVNKNYKVINEINKLRVFERKTIKIRKKIKASLSNGEGIIGYNYLHGVDMKAGGLEIKEVVIGKPSAKVKTVAINCVWHDFLNVNSCYPTDIIKAKIAKLIPGAKPKDCEIAISWPVCISF